MDVPPAGQSLNFTGFFFYPQGQRQRMTLTPLLTLTPKFSSMRSKSSSSRRSSKDAGEKHSVIHGERKAPLLHSNFHPASLGLRREYSLRFLFLWPTSSSESPESLPSSSSPSSSSSSSLIKPFRLPCSSWSSRFSSSSSSEKHSCLSHGAWEKGWGWGRAPCLTVVLFIYSEPNDLGAMLTLLPHLKMQKQDHWLSSSIWKGLSLFYNDHLSSDDMIFLITLVLQNYY